MPEGLMLAIGGLGLFLLGMAVMTDGLRAIADARLRSLLARSTRSPLSGAVTGAITTAIVQSSSATTVAAIGFVGAGLMTFPQALGILFGANIGTTITGWLVALLGFKLKLGTLLLPTVLIGVMFRLFGNERWQGLGNAIAGFGLIFVGISMLQDGMADFSNIITPDLFPPDTFVGRLLLVLIGLVVTVIAQSSSAGVAMALTAVSVGNITLAQAAAMIIGMNVGTTITAMIATIGGSVQARRTGLAHVVFNLMTGVAAFLMLTPFLRMVEIWFPKIADTDPELALVGFHTLFNFAGVIAVLPFTRKFAALITRLVPERGNPLTRRLNTELMNAPDLAVAALQATLCDLIVAIFARLARSLRGDELQQESTDVQEIKGAIEQTHHYLDTLHVPPEKEELVRTYQASIHILDHLHRLMIRIDQRSKIKTIRSMNALRPDADQLAQTAETIAHCPTKIGDKKFATIRREYQQLKTLEKRIRREHIASAARGEYDARTAVTQTDAARTLKRIGHHVWRITRQLKRGYADMPIVTHNKDDDPLSGA
ncbi:MAG: Na/Pi cotransporter family protein [Rubripirellula sp.]|nr:Na/Pi cotransporter family protein [Rubripirellula sp.]